MIQRVLDATAQARQIWEEKSRDIKDQVMCVCMYQIMYVCMYVCIHMLYTQARQNTEGKVARHQRSGDICMYMYIYVYIYIHTCMYVCIHT